VSWRPAPKTSSGRRSARPASPAACRRRWRRPRTQTFCCAGSGSWVTSRRPERSRARGTYLIAACRPSRSGGGAARLTVPGDKAATALWDALDRADTIPTSAQASAARRRRSLEEPRPDRNEVVPAARRPLRRLHGETPRITRERTRPGVVEQAVRPRRLPLSNGRDPARRVGGRGEPNARCHRARIRGALDTLATPSRQGRAPRADVSPEGASQPLSRQRSPAGRRLSEPATRSRAEASGPRGMTSHRATR
jgi:hypothetical protein